MTIIEAVLSSFSGWLSGGVARSIGFDCSTLNVPITFGDSRDHLSIKGVDTGTISAARNNLLARSPWPKVLHRAFFKGLMLSYTNIAVYKGEHRMYIQIFLGCKPKSLDSSASNANLLKYPTNVYPGYPHFAVLFRTKNWPIDSSGFVQSITGCTMDIRICRGFP